MNELQPILPDEIIASKIYIIRGKKVMIDRDLAELYGVDTRSLNQAVKRKIKRFPDDFMFQMTREEMQNWKSQIVISNREKMGLRKPPMVFTEQGVSMLSSVLNSDRAIMVNIQIMRVFTKIHELAESHKEILRKLEQIEKKDIEQDEKIMLIFEYLKQLEQAKHEELERKPKIIKGYRKDKNNKS
jgi:hypothetical protein